MFTHMTRLHHSTVRRSKSMGLRILLTWSLYNWGEVVVSSSSLLEGAAFQASPSDDRPQDPSIRTYRHFVALCHTQGDKQKLVPLSNFESAALYLSYLLEGNTDFPDNPETFVNIMQNRSPPGTEPVGKILRNFNMQQLRAPLHIALAISPLCLVGSTVLNKATPGRPTLCQIWQALGSSRPESLRWAESLLWELLWDFTLHKIELLPNLQRILKLIVIRLSESTTPPTDLTWFTPLRYKPPPKSLKNELKKLRLTPPPTYSESESDGSFGGSPENTKSTTTPPTPHKRPLKQEVKSPYGSVGEEMSSDQGSDDYTSPHQSRKSISSKHLTKKRKKTATVQRKPYKTLKSQVEVQTPSTSTRPLHRDSIMPPYVEIIDLSRANRLTCAPRLGHVVGDPKVVGKTTHQLYSPDENIPALYTPQSHLAEDVQLLGRIVKSAESFYMNGKPRFIVDPHNSGFCMITEDLFRRLTDQAVQDVLRTRQFVIIGPQHPTQIFDLMNLENLSGLNQPIAIYDQSVPLEPGTSRLRSGTLIDIYSSAGSSFGKSLIALELPMTCASAPFKSFASDIKAWSSTAEISDLGHEFPVRSTRWGQASTAGAYHMWRIQREGFATYIEPQAGRQCWIVAKPKRLDKWDETFWNDFRHMHKYTTEEGSPDSPDPTLWDFEAILLKPGHRLILRPNTPFLAIMPEPSICHGGRFYAASTIRESCYGVFHTFLYNNTVDAQHSIDSRKLLRRMLAFCHSTLTSNDNIIRERNTAHVPRIHTFPGLLDLLTLCNIIEMGNILTPKLYTDKDKCNRERHELIEARKLSRTAVDWAFDHYQLSLKGAIVPKSRQALYWPYLAQQAKALLWYKQQTEKSAPSGGLNQTVTYEAVKHAIRCCFRTVVPFWTAWDACPETPSFTWSGPQFDIVRREPTSGHRDHDGKTVDDLIWLGESDDSSDMDDSFSKDMDSEDERLKKKARQG
ncbi:hypothetical protein BDZ94DRAFT_985891 [Collybia nuda]|uniref:Uncharacterized protein n=1 Tax=Collybia nuda TaxID=64659 RepID=A0A9P5Y056_9AGAR|nr:hypothetical protein BDZ94DRAFT_985891 [Collybia nuda]